MRSEDKMDFFLYELIIIVCFQDNIVYVSILLVAIMAFSGQLITAQQADRIQRGMRGYTPPPRLQQGPSVH